jgi:hypothetical protein
MIYNLFSLMLKILMMILVLINYFIKYIFSFFISFLFNILLFYFFIKILNIFFLWNNFFHLSFMLSFFLNDNISQVSFEYLFLCKMISYIILLFSTLMNSCYLFLINLDILMSTLLFKGFSYNDLWFCVYFIDLYLKSNNIFFFEYNAYLYFW